MGRIILVRPLLPPPPQLTARLQPQHLHWQVGRYKERLVSGPGGLGRGRIWVPQLEGEQHNLILDAAYDTLIPQYGFLFLHSYAAVGTGSTPPASTQTALVSEVARTRRDENGGTTGTRNVVYAGTPGVYDVQVTREFIESEVGGRNLTEWGFSPISTPGGTLMARELFRDGTGSPVVLTLDSDQRLRLIYKIRLTITPISQAISLNIANMGVFTGVFRLYRNTSLYNSYGYQETATNADFSLVDAIAKGEDTIFSNPDGFYLLRLRLDWTNQVQSSSYDAGPVNGSLRGSKGLSFKPVSGRSRQVAPQIWGSSEANANDLRSYGIGIVSYSYGTATPGALAYISLDSPISKDNLHKLQIDEWTLTWGP